MRTSSLILAGLMLVAGGCRHPGPDTAADNSPPVTVQTSVVASESFPATIEVPATVRPAEHAVISAKLTGTIATLPWGLGQEVKQGDVLLTLAAPETAARVRQAQAQLAEATRAAEREKKLVAGGVNPADALRDAEDRLHFAQASLAEAEALLTNAIIRAPFAGVITEKPVLPGDLATPGLPLLSLESTARLRAEGTLPESTATSLKPGSHLPVILQDNEPAVEGVIEELSGAADAVSRSVLVKVALPANAARSGQFARLRVSVGRTDALLAATAAITRFGQMERVFVVQEGRAVLRLVKTGRQEGDRTEILSGLQPGETIVVSPPASLREGTQLKVLP